MWNPDTGAAMEPICQIMYYNQLPTCDTIHEWTLSPRVGRFHIDAVTDVESGHWGRHQVSFQGTDVSNHVLQSIDNFCWHHSQVDPGSGNGLVPHWCTHRCGTRTQGRTPRDRSWNRCVKSVFIINCQLLTLFTSETWLQKKASSTLVDPDYRSGRFHIGALTDVQPGHSMCQMCQIMFCNQLPTSDTIHKWSLAPEVGRFHIDAVTDV